MVDHLKRVHYVHDLHQGRELADKWKFESGKQAWSCGFCIRPFTSLDARLKHITDEYRDNHQTHESWNVTNVIKGLLLQPGVVDAWESLLATLYGRDRPELIWSKDTIGDLQSMLEKGPSLFQDAVYLAEAACNAAKVDPDILNPSDPASLGDVRQYTATNEYVYSVPAVQLPMRASADTVATQLSTVPTTQASTTVSYADSQISGTHRFPSNGFHGDSMLEQEQFPSSAFDDEEDFSGLSVSCNL